MKTTKVFIIPVFANGGARLIAPGDLLKVLLADLSTWALLVVTAYDASRKEITYNKAGAPGTVQTASVASANASNEATSITLANEEKARYNSLVEEYKLVASVTGTTFAAVPETTANATALASVQTLLNSLKPKYNALRAAIVALYASRPALGSQTAAAEATADASDQTTANALANSLKTNINAARADMVKFLTFNGGSEVGYIPDQHEIQAVGNEHRGPQPPG